jgi:hypothetical protein
VLCAVNSPLRRQRRRLVILGLAGAVVTAHSVLGGDHMSDGVRPSTPKSARWPTTFVAAQQREVATMKTIGFDMPRVPRTTPARWA